MISRKFTAYKGNGFTNKNKNFLIQWLRQRVNPKKYGATPKKSALVYGAPNTGKKTAITQILEQMEYEIVLIDQRKSMNDPDMFSDRGVMGLHAYIIDLDNMQGFPSPPKTLNELRAPIIYVCVNPFKKVKGKSWSEVQKQFLVIDASKDSDLLKYKKPKRTKDGLGQIHQVDLYVKSLPPWDLVNKISSSVTGLQEKIKATGHDPSKISSVLRGNIDKINDLKRLSIYSDIVSQIDLIENKRNCTGYGTMDDYKLCMIVQSLSAMKITPRTRLSYKLKREPRIQNPSVTNSQLYSSERFCVLNIEEVLSLPKKGRGSKRKKTLQIGKASKLPCSKKKFQS